MLLSHGPIGISQEAERLEYVAIGPNRLLCQRVDSENTKRADSERESSPCTLIMATHGCPTSHEPIWHLEWHPTPLKQVTYRYGPILIYSKRIYHLGESIPLYGLCFISAFVVRVSLRGQGIYILYMYTAIT